jgi:transcriptional regulator with XRE-family HTH domain
MGKKARERPGRLAEKLMQIRRTLGDSQNELIRRMGLQAKTTQADISEYERGEREPPLKVLLHYARAANVYVDTLIDDEIDLPEKLPPRRKSMGVRKKRKRGKV